MAKMFIHDGKTYTYLRSITTCSDFSWFVSQISIRDRYRYFGKPYKGGNYVRLFERNLEGVILPFWVKHFSCPGIEVPKHEIRRLLQPLLLLPTPIREDIGGKGKKLPPVKEKSVRPPRAERSKTSLPPVGTTNVTGDLKMYYWEDGAPRAPFVSTGLSPHVIRHFSVQKVSVSTPNFKLIKKADRPFHPFSYKRISASEDEGILDGKAAPGYTNTLVGYLRASLGQTPNSYVASYSGTLNDRGSSNAALQRTLMKSKAMSVNLGQAYAERKQTVNLMMSSVNRLIALALALKKGDVKKARNLVGQFKDAKSVSILDRTGTRVVAKRLTRVRKSPKREVTPETFANLWLEFQYGWKPFLSDIYGSCELIADTYYRKKPMQVSTQIPFSFKQAAELEDYTNLEGSTFYSYRTLAEEGRSRVVLQFREEDDVNRFLTRTGIANPALLAWELLPYSFVLDWFVPVGAYLNALDATVGLNFIRGATTVSGTRSVESTWKRIGTAGHATMSGSKLRITTKVKNRSVYTTVPSPPRPQFNPQLGATRLTSALSLLTQIFYSGKTSVRI